MVSLKQLFEWFTTGKFPTEAQFAEQFKSFWHKSERIDQSSVLGLPDALADKATKEDLANATTNFKGYHTSLAALLAIHPQNENRKDFFAWVGSPYPGTVYKVFANGGAWTDTGEVPTQQEIDLAEYAKLKDNEGNKVVYVKNGVVKIETSDSAVNLYEGVGFQNKAINATTGELYDYPGADVSKPIPVSGLNRIKMSADNYFDSRVCFFKDKELTQYIGMVSNGKSGTELFQTKPIQHDVMSGSGYAFIYTRNVQVNSGANFSNLTFESAIDAKTLLTIGSDSVILDGPEILKIHQLGTDAELDNILNGTYLVNRSEIKSVDLERIEVFKNQYFDSNFEIKESIWGDGKVDAVICELSQTDKILISTYISSSTSQYVFLLDESKNVIKEIQYPTGVLTNELIDTENAKYIALNDNKGYPFLAKGCIYGNSYVRQYYKSDVLTQDKYDIGLNRIAYRTRTGNVWNNWIYSVYISSDGKDYVSPNDIASGTQIERINEAINRAIKTNRRIVIPRVDEIEGTNKWLIDSAIVLPSNITIELNNCHIQQSDLCRDNIFRTANVEVGKTTFETLENIHIKGIGTVILEGANNPRSTGDWNKKLTLNSTIGTWESYGSDAGKAGQNQYGGWLNNTFCLVNTSVFSIDNVIVREPHAWGMMAAYCANGVISNITIEGNGYRVINGVKQYIKNQGAFIAVQGCHDIEFNNFYGYNSDDIIEIGTLLWTAGSAEALVHVAGNQNNISPTGDVYKDSGDDTYNIVIRNIFAKAEAENVVYALIKFGASNLQKQYNITVDNVFSTKPATITFDYYNTNGGKSIAHSFRNIGSNISFWCRNEKATIPQYSTFRDIWFTGEGEIFDTYILNGQGNVFENARKISI